MVIRKNELIEDRHSTTAAAFVRLLNTLALGAQDDISRSTCLQLADYLYFYRCLHPRIELMPFYGGGSLGKKV
jgi:hypothetical protein